MSDLVIISTCEGCHRRREVERHDLDTERDVLLCAECAQKEDEVVRAILRAERYANRGGFVYGAPWWVFNELTDDDVEWEHQTFGDRALVKSGAGRRGWEEPMPEDNGYSVLYGAPTEEESAKIIDEMAAITIWGDAIGGLYRKDALRVWAIVGSENHVIEVSRDGQSWEPSDLELEGDFEYWRIRRRET